MLAVFLLLYLWQSMAVRNPLTEDWACTTETVAGGRSYKACSSAKCISKAFPYLFLNPLPLILMATPPAYFLQSQFLPKPYFSHFDGFLQWMIVVIPPSLDALFRVTCSSLWGTQQTKPASGEWLCVTLTCTVLVWTGTAFKQCTEALAKRIMCM